MWVAGLKQRRPALFSSCSWGGLYFLATSTGKEEVKERVSTREGVEFENPFFSCHKKLHAYTICKYIYVFKRTLAEERGGLLMCVFLGLPVFNVIWGCLDAIPMVHAMLSPSVLSYTMEGHNEEVLCVWSQPHQQQPNQLDWNSPHSDAYLQHYAYKERLFWNA